MSVCFKLISQMGQTILPIDHRNRKNKIVEHTPKPSPTDTSIVHFRLWTSTKQWGSAKCSWHWSWYTVTFYWDYPLGFRCMCALRSLGFFTTMIFVLLLSWRLCLYAKYTMSISSPITTNNILLIKEPIRCNIKLW